MRDDYVKIIKEYINSKPELEHTLDTIRTNTLLIGATEEEFNEAIKQLTGIPNVSDALTGADNANNKKQNKLPKFFKNKKVSATLACVVFVLIGSVLIKLNSTDTNVTQQASTVPGVEKKVDPVQQVYASNNPIDGKSVFSYPPTNVSLVVTGKPKKEVVGFFPYWMVDEQDQVGLNGLTTVNLFGITMDGKGNIVTAGGDGTPDGGWVMWNNKTLDTLIASAKRKGLKVNLTFKCFNNTDIESLVASDDNQKRFISNVLYMINAKNLNGVNIDFEYLGTPPDKTRDGFTRFITNLNAALKQQSQLANLTIDTYVTSGQTPGIFDIQALEEKVDAFVIMGYDVHTPQGDPGAVAPMQGDSNLVGLLQSYLEKVPANKIILAVPYYGYDWITDVDHSETPAIMVPYAQAAEVSKSQRILWDNASQTPYYLYTQNQQKHEVFFENVRSLSIKYDYINEKNLQGVGIWALGYDGLNTDLQNLLVDKFAK